MQDRVALVTGGASGIGRAVCLHLGRLGTKLIVADLNAAGAQSVADEIRTAGGHAAAVELDVCKPDQVAAAFDATEATFGIAQILVTCAGIGQLKAFLDTDLETWNDTLAVNLTGTFLCAQAAARRMVGTGWGRIVTIGSINSERAITGRNAYAASKGGVAMLTKVMAVELAAHGITVNALAPGPIDTPMAQQMHTRATREAYLAHLPIKRYGTPEKWPRRPGSSPRTKQPTSPARSLRWMAGSSPPASCSTLARHRPPVLMPAAPCPPTGRRNQPQYGVRPEPLTLC